MFWFGTMHTGWVKNKTHKTSTSRQMINGVQLYHPPETLSALMTINYPVVLLLVYREGGSRWARHRRHLFHPFFVRFVLESVGPASASIWGIHRSRVEGDVSVSSPLYSAPL